MIFGYHEEHATRGGVRNLEFDQVTGPELIRHHDDIQQPRATEVNLLRAFGGNPEDERVTFAWLDPFQNGLAGIHFQSSPERLERDQAAPARSDIWPDVDRHRHHRALLEREAVLRDCQARWRLFPA